MNDIPTEQEMAESLQRSGYLLEGRLIRDLTTAGLFVEPNQSMLDPRTGISRELDMVAESWRYNPKRSKICVKSTYVIEAVNNSFPVALLTTRISTPNSLPQHLLYKMTPQEEYQSHPFVPALDILKEKGVYQWNIHSQYCSFSRKKRSDQLMAHHPDDLHTSIRKTVEFSLVASNEHHAWMDDKVDEYWRIFQWYPVVVLADHLYVVGDDPKNACSLTRTKHAVLEYNFHFNNRPISSAVHFVTERELLFFIAECEAADDETEEKIFQIRQKVRTD